MESSEGWSAEGTWQRPRLEGEVCAVVVVERRAVVVVMRMDRRILL